MFLRAGDHYVNVAQITRARRLDDDQDGPRVLLALRDEDLALSGNDAREALAALDACCIAVPPDDVADGGA
jgi:hypothetical protein